MSNDNAYLQMTTSFLFQSQYKNIQWHIPIETDINKKKKKIFRIKRTKECETKIYMCMFTFVCDKNSKKFSTYELFLPPNALPFVSSNKK